MTELTKMKLAEARDALRKGDVTSVELTEACLSAIEGADALGAFVHKTPEIALEQAKAADARIKAGDAPAMCGLPIGVTPDQSAHRPAARFRHGFRVQLRSAANIAGSDRRRISGR